MRLWLTEMNWQSIVTARSVPQIDFNGDNRLAMGMLSSGSRETRWKFKNASFIIANLTSVIHINLVLRCTKWSSRSRPLHAGKIVGSNPTSVLLVRALGDYPLWEKGRAIMGREQNEWEDSKYLWNARQNKLAQKTLDDSMDKAIELMLKYEDEIDLKREIKETHTQVLPDKPAYRTSRATRPLFLAVVAQQQRGLVV